MMRKKGRTLALLVLVFSVALSGGMEDSMKHLNRGLMVEPTVKSQLDAQTDGKAFMAFLAE
jgi:hypothetical protein